MIRKIYENHDERFNYMPSGVIESPVLTNPKIEQPRYEVTYKNGKVVKTNIYPINLEKVSEICFITYKSVNSTDIRDMYKIYSK